MSNWDMVAVNCPHCAKLTTVEVDTQFDRVHDAHIDRKSFDELPTHGSEREVRCDVCKQMYHVTLVRRHPKGSSLQFFRTRSLENRSSAD